LVACAIAHKKVLEQFTRVFPSVPFNFTNLAAPMGNQAQLIKPALNGLKNYLDGLRDLGIANATGINFFDYFRFKAIIPHVSFYGDGRPSVTHKIRKTMDSECSFCVGFITSLAIAVQDKLKASYN
jgi:hypothetical protein